MPHEKPALSGAGFPVAVRRAAALPAVVGDPGAALTPRGAEQLVPAAATAVVTPVPERGEAPAPAPVTSPEPRQATELDEASGLWAAAAGEGADGDADGAGEARPLLAGPRKPMLAAAAMAGALLIAVPFLVLALGDDDKPDHSAAVTGTSGTPGTVLAPGEPDGSANPYSTTSPSASPSVSPSAKVSAASAKASGSPSAARRTGKAQPVATTAAKSTATTSAKGTSAGSASTPTAGTVTHTVNLALGKAVDVDNHTQDYVGSNITDGDASSYWESTNGTDQFPHLASVDLGAEKSVAKVVLKLPPIADWNSRDQTLIVYGAHNTNSSFVLVSSATYTFDAATGSTVTIRFTATSTRYVQVWFTANSGWPASQPSELAAY